MRKRILVSSIVLALVLVLVVPLAVKAEVTDVQGNVSSTIDFDVPLSNAITLTPGTTSTTTDTITVSCSNTSWSVTATDADATTGGHMTAYATTAAGYDTTSPEKLASAMSVIAASGPGATGDTALLPTGGTILTGSQAVELQGYTLTFSQPVSYVDAILTGDGSDTEYPNTYRIVVTFTASTS